MRILFLSSWFPYPPNNGSKLRIYNLLRGLARHHQVTLLSFADQPHVDPEIPELRPLCDQVQVIPWKPFNPRSRQARLGFLSLTPRSIVDTFSSEMAGCIEERVSSGDYDLVIASQWAMASYGPCFQGLPALLEEVEVGVPYEQFARATSLWRRFRYGLTWAKHRAYLARLLRHFKACTVVSEQERRLLSRAIPGYQAIEVVPNCINLVEYSDVRESPQANSLIFTGSFRYFANHDAMTWFLQEVYPPIRAQVPEVRLTITGDHAGRPLPAADNVTLTGFVDDVRPLIASAWISLVPIRVGGGTRLKILEAMALGTPVVATSKGAEGLDVQDGEHILIADTPEAFARAVLRLLADPGLRSRLADNASKLVRDRYDWAAVMPGFLDLIERVAHA
ncbi:MAG: glycosyltransferase family 4 protein [Anaerolineae bacterium]